MTVTAAFCPLSLQTLLDLNGKPIVGGLIYVNDAGTTNLRATYGDAAMQSQNVNPLVSDAFGRIPKIYVGEGPYKVVAQDPLGAQLFLVDDLPGGIDYDALAADAAADAGAGMSGHVTGDVKWKPGTSIDTGWLLANGGTIGNAGSQATARANADTQALFVYLWNNLPNLAVSGGARGVTATADFNASKTIALIDLRGIVQGGCDQMGAASARGLVTAASTATPDQAGTLFGAETTALTGDQLPAITPQITVTTDGSGHVHDASSVAAGSHNHSGTTGAAGAHQHTLPPLSNINNITEGGGTGGAKNSGSTSGINTGGVSDHNHNISTDGAHTHVINIGNGQSAHTHGVVAQPLGQGHGHANMQPTVLGYFHIKL